MHLSIPLTLNQVEGKLRPLDVFGYCKGLLNGEGCMVPSPLLSLVGQNSEPAFNSIKGGMRPSPLLLAGLIPLSSKNPSPSSNHVCPPNPSKLLQP